MNFANTRISDIMLRQWVVSETLCRMRQADCTASVGADWKEEIEADFQKRHHR